MTYRVLIERYEALIARKNSGKVFGLASAGIVPAVSNKIMNMTYLYSNQARLNAGRFSFAVKTHGIHVKNVFASYERLYPLQNLRKARQNGCKRHFRKKKHKKTLKTKVTEKGTLVQEGQRIFFSYK
ncbi:MAG: hypothetical protein IKN04_04425 [Clostridia bacterium]|nr:hypothetical protein [Clostridia bacterium]